MSREKIAVICFVSSLVCTVDYLDDSLSIQYDVVELSTLYRYSTVEVERRVNKLWLAGFWGPIDKMSVPDTVGR